MKLTYEYLDEVYLTCHGNFRHKNSAVLIYKDVCKECGEPYLTSKQNPGEYCSNSCSSKHLPPLSVEACKKISETKKGCIGYWKDKRRTEEQKKKQSESQIGNKNSNYKHGLWGTKEYKKYHDVKRRALKAGAEGSHTIEDLEYIYDHQKGICGKCKRYIPFKKMTVDHIVPISWGGSNYASNIQMLCLSCNSSKGAHQDTDYRDYVPLFLGE